MQLICLLISSICLLISHAVFAHGYFAYVDKTSFAYAEHLVHKGVTVILALANPKNWILATSQLSMT